MYIIGNCPVSYFTVEVPGKNYLVKTLRVFFSEDIDMAGKDVWCVLEESATVVCHCVLLAISHLQLRCFI